jgi:phospholipid/cholesterol/gamma-HCH transport system ATP-binding protein
MKPKILLYDEPTTGLDPVSTKNVDDMIRDVSREHGVTSVIISHDMASTFRIGDRISALYGGVMIESGPPEGVSQQSSQVAARVYRDERRGADDAL